MTTVKLNSVRAGRWIVQSSGPEGFKSFFPAPLPPDPPLAFDPELQDLEERANRALGRLEGISFVLPDPELFLYSYVRKEAVFSSQIEGTQFSLSDLLLFENKEAPGVPVADAREVSNYVSAMDHGLKRLKAGFPISLRLIREIHALLLKDARGGEKEPGEFRRSQNWIGGTRPGNAIYVPPPTHEVLPAMGALEKFLHNDPVPTPALIKAGLAHAQFETIHPFLDGNGRIGRLLITFILCAEGALTQPLLYLSLFFKEHRTEYYDALQRIRTEGDWEGWLKLYLSGIETTSNQACETAKKLFGIFEQHRSLIHERLGRASGSALRLHDILKKEILLSIPSATAKLKLSFQSTTKAFMNLQKIGIVREFTGRQRNRLFSYELYLKVLSEGT
ncbi:MAG: Fic family protein [Deltaproteobacteria bacterium]|nr:Fic family protein [Deltaproteobacteria bacterium]